MGLEGDFSEKSREKTAPSEVTLSYDGIGAIESTLGDTVHDVSDMRRLGKKQEFRVCCPR